MVFFDCARRYSRRASESNSRRRVGERPMVVKTCGRGEISINGWSADKRSVVKQISTCHGFVRDIASVV